MHRIIVTAFTTLDGVVEDPDGSFGSPVGGWALRHGPATFAGDPFHLTPLLARGALVLGGATWTRFADRWPRRTGAFADAMNAAPKLVASRTLTDVRAWSASALLQGDVIAAMDRERRHRDLIVVGSTSIVHALAARAMVDEYRLVVLPSIVGPGARLSAPGTPPQDLRLVAADATGATVLLRYERASADGAGPADPSQNTSISVPSGS